MAAHEPFPASESESEPALPARFGSYEIVRRIGRGGMATVLEARHERLGGRVALKVLSPQLAAQPLAAARFLREAKASAQIRHEHVLRVFDIGTQDGLPFLVMEFLEGEDLAALLARRQVLPVAEMVRIFLPVISAVAAAHAAGIVHRDLKPANVMLARRPPYPPQPVVLDFGISKLEGDDGEAALTRSESLLGTIQYMAPELTRAARHASPASDQYALGVMLYECATGRRPFRGEGHYELLHAIVNASITAPRSYRASLPPEFEAIVLRALSREPSKRYPSLRELGAALCAVGDEAIHETWTQEFALSAAVENEAEPAEVTLRDEPSPRASRRAPLGRRSVAVGLIAIALVAIAAWVLARREPAPRGTVDVPAAARLPEASPTPAEPARAANPSEPTALVGRPAGDKVAAPVSSQAAPGARTKVAVARRARAPAPTNSRTSAAGTPAPPATDVGKNGAPILE